jgi:type I restriction enzyme M protein
MEILGRVLENYIDEDDKELSTKELIEKYNDELNEFCAYDKDTKDIFGLVNTSWVFCEVSKELKELKYTIFMAEVENIGYKRTKRGEKPMPNELFRINEKDEILVDDGIMMSALDHIRQIEWGI